MYPLCYVSNNASNIVETQRCFLGHNYYSQIDRIDISPGIRIGTEDVVKKKDKRCDTQFLVIVDFKASCESAMQRSKHHCNLKLLLWHDTICVTLYHHTGITRIVTS